MQPVDPSKIEQTVASRYRTLLILWFAQLMAIVMFAVLTTFIRSDRKFPPNSSNNLTFILAGLGLLIVLASLLVRSKLAASAIEQRSFQKLQLSYVLAYAMCEAAGLLGFIDFIIADERYYHLLFIIGVFGLGLHLPKRDAILAAMPGNRF